MTAPVPAWPQGMHLIADLSGCSPSHPWMTDAVALREACLQAVAQAGLTAVGERFHRFEVRPFVDTDLTGHDCTHGNLQGFELSRDR